MGSLYIYIYIDDVTLVNVAEVDAHILNETHIYMVNR
jgi:hypothetical protein